MEVHAGRPAVAGLLLAAGASTRLGEPKQLLLDDTGTPAVARMARVLAAGGCAPVLVVVGASAEAVEGVLAHEPVQIVRHAMWAHGMGSSIAAGMRALQTAAPKAAGVLVAACDMPTVDARHVERLLGQFRGDNRVASQYLRDDGAEVRGIPAVLPRADWAWLGALTGDQGARPLLHPPETLTVSLRDGHFDLDTPDAVQRWRHPTRPFP